MDDAKRAERFDNHKLPRPRRRTVVRPYLLSAPPIRDAGRKRRQQEPACPINRKDPKLGETINDWLTALRQTVDEQQVTDPSSETSANKSGSSLEYVDSISHYDQQNSNYRRPKERQSNSTTGRKRQQRNLHQAAGCSSSNSTYSQPTDSYSQPSTSYYDRCMDNNHHGTSFNDQSTSFFELSANYQDPKSTCNEPQASNNIERNYFPETSEPVDPVTSETLMYVLSDYEEPPRRRRRKRTKKKRLEGSNCHGNKRVKYKDLSDEGTADVFDNAPNRQTASEIAEPLGPVATKTYMSVLSDNAKPRKRRRQRKKRKVPRNHGNKEVTSHDNDRAIAAMRRFREAEINILCYKLEQLTLEEYTTDRRMGEKRKDVPRESGCDLDSLDVNIKKLCID